MKCQQIISMKDIRLTVAEIAADLEKDRDTIIRKLGPYKPLGFNQNGDPLYGMRHLCAAAFRP